MRQARAVKELSQAGRLVQKNKDVRRPVPEVEHDSYTAKEQSSIQDQEGEYEGESEKQAELVTCSAVARVFASRGQGGVVRQKRYVSLQGSGLVACCVLEVS